MKLGNVIKRIFGINKKSPVMVGLRGYKSAKTNRLTFDWLTFNRAADFDVFQDGARLRARARDLYLNNDYVRKYVLLMVQNVVGPDGFILQNQAKDINGNYDIGANNIIENAWYDWGLYYADVQGVSSFRQLCEIVVKQLVIDGEIFIRIVRNKSKYGIQLQIIEADYVDEKLNETLKNGNHIRMGIELDQWRRPVAYYIKAIDIESELYASLTTTKNVRVPASEIIHIFSKDRANQTRGVSWLAPAMLRLKMLQEYEDAAVINARISASKMGFFTSQTPIGEFSTKESIEVEPGVFEELPPGYSFIAFDPKFPSEQHGSFVKSMLRGIASGLGVSYNTLANDLEGVNYSSIRAGLLDEREFYKTVQAMVIEKLLIPVFKEWLLESLTRGVLKGSELTDPLPVRKFDKFFAPVFYGRRWSWVDPLRDIEAEALAVEKGFKTNSEVLADRGRDINDVYEQLAKEKTLQKKYGLIEEDNTNNNGRSKNKRLIKELIKEE
jgi:lambda family phage portal protein